MYIVNQPLHNPTLIICSGTDPSPTAASFVRPTRPADQPLSFLEALREKYAPEDALKALEHDRPIEISGKLVEEVGFEKVRRQQAILQELRVVVLDGFRVAGLHSKGSNLRVESKEWQTHVGEIAETCPKVRELDLSRSLIERWVDVIGICSALPDLRRLVLRYPLFFSCTSTDTYRVQLEPVP